jgi:RNA polymerase sigma-70 factor (ECF subfamily)
MTGSVVDGKDIVQETLARAFQESHVFADAEGESRGAGLRRWLFHVAYRQAIDYLGRYERRMGRPLDDNDQPSAENDASGEEAVIRQEAVHAAIARFLELPPVQRSSVVRRDVLGHSAEEVGALLGIGVPAVKSALPRGRESLGRKRAEAEHEPVAPPVSPISGLASAAGFETSPRTLPTTPGCETGTCGRRGSRAKWFSPCSSMASQRLRTSCASR